MIGGDNGSLARAWNSAYLKAMARPIPAQNRMLSATPPKARVEARVASVIVWGARPIPARNPMLSTAPPRTGVASVIVWSAAVLGVLAAAGAAALWIYYGTAVFFELIAAGISACF